MHTIGKTSGERVKTIFTIQFHARIGKLMTLSKSITKDATRVKVANILMVGKNLNITLNPTKQKNVLNRTAKSSSHRAANITIKMTKGKIF
jgi:hypothetical protein